MIILLNEWTYNSPVFGRIVKMLGYIHVGEGFETAIPKVEEALKNGYSVMVFPEGTRSVDGEIKRFRKGTFYLAEKMKLDIIPVLFHGLGDALGKGDFLVKKGTLTTSFLPKIMADDLSFGTDYSEKTKKITAYYRQEYFKLREKLERPAYFKNKLVNNYKFRGWNLILALRARLSSENNFTELVNLFPHKAKVWEFGCGNGFYSFMLSFVFRESKITAVDPDPEKILVAENCFSKNDRLHFICQSIAEIIPEKADVYFLNDLSKHLSSDVAQKLILNCFDLLDLDGSIIISRYANDSSLGLWNRLADFFEGYRSKRFESTYHSEIELRKILGEHNFNIQIIYPHQGLEII